MLKPPVRTALEQNVLPNWLPTRRWFGHKEAPIEQVEIVDGAAFGEAQAALLLTELAVTCAGQTHRYQVPLGALGEEQPSSTLAQQAVLSRGLPARVRHPAGQASGGQSGAKRSRAGAA